MQKPSVTTKIKNFISKTQGRIAQTWRKASKRHKTIFLVTLALLLIIIAVGTFVLIKSSSNVVETESLTSETEILKQNVTMEAGDEFDITKIVSDQDILDGDYDVKIYLIDAEGKETEVSLITKYYDTEGNEVAKETAVAIDENGKETLNEGYTTKQFLPEVGKYKIVITDAKGKKHETTITVKDTTAPVLALKEVRITKGTAITPGDFVESCHDNSGKDCILAYVDEAGNEIAEITGEVGEHVIRIIGKDPSGNKTGIQEAKLVIEEPKPAVAGGGGSGGGSTGAPSSASRGGYSSGNPYAAAALSLVGRKGMDCLDVVWYVLDATGKSVEVISSYNTQYLNPHVPKYYSENEVDIYSTHTFEGSKELGVYVPVEGAHNTWAYESSAVGIIYHSSNNVVTGAEPKVPLDARYQEAFDRYASGVIGKESYKIVTTARSGYLFSDFGVQYGFSARISLGDLQPGDFIYWSPWNGRVSHWAVYIGNGKAVHGGWDSAGSVVIAGVTSGVFPAARPAPIAWRIIY